MWKKNSVLLKAASLVMLTLLIPSLSLADSVSAARDVREAAKAVRMENYQRALQLYSRAAANENAEAQFQLANLYRLGRGVAKNAAQQRHWLDRAASKGHPGAQYSLALLLQQSDGQRARQLMQAAAKQDFSPAQRYLQRIGETQLGSGNTQLAVVERWFAAARKNQVDSLAALRDQLDGVDVLGQQQRSALAIAVQAGSDQVVRWLLKHGANPLQRDRFGKGIGFMAIDSRDAAMLDVLLAAGLDTRQTLPNGDNLLHYAVRRGYDEALPSLLKKTKAVNARNVDGWTALDLARFAENQSAAMLLQKHGAKPGAGWQTNVNASRNIMARQWTGEQQPDVTQLAAIVSAGNAHLLRQLGTANPSLIRQPLADGSSLLALAIVNGQQAVVSSLLELGADANDRVAGEFTALQWAARSGQGAIAMALIARGAKTNETDKAGHDAIELALLNGHPDLAIEMLDQGNAGKPVSWDRYAYTAATVDADEFVEHISPKLKKLYRDSNGRSALWFAASHGNAGLLKVMLRRGLRDDQADANGKTPLMLAVQRGCLPCVEQLARTADLNQTNAAGDSALIVAAANADQAMVRWLISHDADVQLRNALGDSALLAAVRANATEVARELVIAGASVSRKNNMGLSAMDVAKKKSPQMQAVLTTD